MMRLFLVLKIAIALIAVSTTSVAAGAQGDTRAALSPSAVSAGTLPSCPADGGGRLLKEPSGRHPFAGSLSGGMYGQTFFAGGGASSVQPGSMAASSLRPPRSGEGRVNPPPRRGGGNGPGDAQGPPNGVITDVERIGPVPEPIAIPEPGFVTPAVTPEPGTLLLIGAGLGALAVRRRQAKKG